MPDTARSNIAIVILRCSLKSLHKVCLAILATALSASSFAQINFNHLPKGVSRSTAERLYAQLRAATSKKGKMSDAEKRARRAAALTAKNPALRQLADSAAARDFDDQVAKIFQSDWKQGAMTSALRANEAKHRDLVASAERELQKIPGLKSNLAAIWPTATLLTLFVMQETLAVQSPPPPADQQFDFTAPYDLGVQ